MNFTMVSGNYNNPLKSCIVTYHDINLMTVRYYVNTVF